MPFLIITVIAIVFMIWFWYRDGYYGKEIQNFESKVKSVARQFASDAKKLFSKVNQVQNKFQVSGHEFENCVVELFSKEYFTLQEWRSDKVHNGVYPVSNTYPDMEWTFKNRNQTIKFAIECKWRSAFQRNGNVQWAMDYQLENYRKFEREKGMTVFVILGISGRPSKPREMYIIPLRHINDITLSRHQLANYRRHSALKPFFLSPHKLRLD